MPPLVVSALALVRDRRLLVVRARGRRLWYLPGGKVEPGEGAADAAVREAREEIGVELDRGSLRELFTVVTRADGGPPDAMVAMTVFAGEPVPGGAAPQASGEVDELHWATTADLADCPPAGVETLRRLHADGLVD